MLVQQTVKLKVSPCSQEEATIEITDAKLIQNYYCAYRQNNGRLIWKRI